MIDLKKYIENLPHWHKHRSGHIAFIEKFENGNFIGSFWNYASGSKMNVSVPISEHMSCLERGELFEVKPEELAKYLLMDENK